MNIFKNEDKKSKIIYISLLLIIVFISVFLSWKAGFETAPDEGMKYELIEYLATHNKLPHGGNPKIINKMWGTSYGFTPYLSYIFSAIFVKIIMLFSTDLKILIFAARLVSVIFYVLYFHFIWKISKKLFKDSFKYLFVVLCTFLPSIVYLGTYINTDMFALFVGAFIFNEWLNGIENNWDNKTCILLGVGLGLCFLSHYYYYGYILCSFILYLISNYIKKIKFKTFFKKGIIIFIVAFIVSGWWFIRQHQLYDGDIFALNISSEYSEKYADELHQPDYLAERARNSFNITTWLFRSVYTLYGEFRYNDIHYNPLIYCIFLGFTFIGIVLLIIRRIQNKNSYLTTIENKKEEKTLIYMMILLIIIPLILSAYYSSTTDYQPQGRYLLPGSISIMLFISYGYQYLFKNNKKSETIFITTIIIIFLIMPIYTYYNYLKGNIEVKIENRTG